MQPLSAEPVHFGPQPGVEQSRETRGDVGVATSMISSSQPSPPAHGDSRRSSQISPSQVQRSQLPSNAPSNCEGDGSESDTPQKTELEGDYQVLSHSLPSSIGYLSNRWNFGSSFSSTPGRVGEESFRYVVTNSLIISFR